MQTVAETPIFIRRAESLLSEDEHADLITRADLTPEQRKSVRTFATAIKALRKRK
jgi:hypothetical protein